MAHARPSPASRLFSSIIGGLGFAFALTLVIPAAFLLVSNGVESDLPTPYFDEANAAGSLGEAFSQALTNLLPVFDSQLFPGAHIAFVLVAAIAVLMAFHRGDDHDAHARVQAQLGVDEVIAADLELWILRKNGPARRRALDHARAHLDEDGVDALLNKHWSRARTVGERVDELKRKHSRVVDAGLSDQRRSTTRASAPAEAPMDPARDLEVRLGAARRRHADVENAYGAYLTDPQECLRRPLLSDVRDPLTGEFMNTLEELGHLTPDTSYYADTVERAWKAWRAASDNATRVGLGQLTSGEAKRVRTAQDLLALALDPSASTHERQNAYKRVLKLVGGVVTMPPRATAAIDAAMRPALEAHRSRTAS